MAGEILVAGIVADRYIRHARFLKVGDDHIASASTEIVIVKGNAYLFRAERLNGIFGRNLSVDCIRRAAAEHVGILGLLKLGACAAG